MAKMMVVVVMMMMLVPVLGAEAGAGAGGGEDLYVGKLRSTPLSSLGSAPPAEGPHDPDWLVPLGAILIALVFLSCVTACAFSRWRSCRDCNGGGSKVSMFGHECLAASVATVVLIVLSLAGLYYFFCFRGGCFGEVMAKMPTGAAGGRKLKILTR